MAARASLGRSPGLRRALRRPHGAPGGHRCGAGLAHHRPVDEEPLSSYGRDNHVRATFYAETLQTLQPIVLQFPILWYNVAERLPAIREIARARGFAIEENLKELDAHIEANVPKLDPDAPLTMEALMRKDGDFAPIDHPDIWLKWDQTLAALNANGEQFQAGELLHEDRKRPSPLLKRALEYGVADQFFTYENWRDAPKADLSATLAAIPEGVRKAIPNLQQLIAAISKDERALQRGIA